MTNALKERTFWIITGGPYFGHVCTDVWLCDPPFQEWAKVTIVYPDKSERPNTDILRKHLRP
jgi:hypothetical protein